MPCGTDNFCGGGVSRPDVQDTVIGQQFVDLLGKADTRTQQLFDLMQPLLQTGQQQAGDVMSGMTGPFTPAIQGAMGQGMSTLGSNLGLQQEAWNRQGVTGTDYDRMTSDFLRQGGQQLATVPAQFTQPMLQAVFQSLTGAPGLAVQSQQGGLGAAGGVTSTQIQPVGGKPFSLLGPICG